MIERYRLFGFGTLNFFVFVNSVVDSLRDRRLGGRLRVLPDFDFEFALAFELDFKFDFELELELELEPVSWLESFEEEFDFADASRSTV